MKRIFLVVMTLVVALAGCKKDDSKNCGEVNLTAPAAEIESLKTFLQTNNITATADPRGFFYTVQAAGSGTKPTICSNVTVDYVGKLTNGTVFDSGNGVSFDLGGLIVGWQEAIPLIATGGSMTLYLPPSLAYGSQPNGDIPANSNLIFQLNLKNVY